MREMGYENLDISTAEDGLRRKLERKRQI